MAARELMNVGFGLREFHMQIKVLISFMTIGRTEYDHQPTNI